MPVTANVNSLNMKQCRAKSKRSRKGYQMILDPETALRQRLGTVFTQKRYVRIASISPSLAVYQQYGSEQVRKHCDWMRSLFSVCN